MVLLEDASERKVGIADPISFRPFLRPETLKLLFRVYLWLTL